MSTVSTVINILNSILGRDQDVVIDILNQDTGISRRVRLRQVRGTRRVCLTNEDVKDLFLC